MPNFLEHHNGVLSINPHEGQMRIFNSTKRIIAAIAGAQSGKTQCSPCWLWQEMQRCGPGTYMGVTPTYPLLDGSLLPKFREFFEDVMQAGTYFASPSRRFVLSDDGARRLWGHKSSERTTVRFGYASDPNSLEAVTLRALICDEAGQPEFKRASWEGLYTRRLAVHQGRVLITTTPYNVDGWLRELCDQADAGDPEIDLIRFDSTANPAFSQASWDEAKRTLPPWKFDLFFRGIFSRPAGQIYDCFEDSQHLIKRFPIPAGWPRFAGMDFGGINTCCTYWAQELKATDRPDYWGAPTGRYICYRTYLAGNKTAKQHTADILKGEASIPKTFGGAASEGQWRNEFAQSGLPIDRPPISDVEVGIDRVYGAFKSNQIAIFDDLKPLISDLRGYSRKTDPNGLVMEEIANKATFHFCDTARYLWSALRSQQATVKRVSGAAREQFQFVG